jgi:NADPH2:quinone reductase
MNHAIRLHETGGPEKLVWEEVPVPSPKPGEALVRHAAVGLNFIDIYFRTGLYKVPSLPAVIGMEAAGTVEAVGEGVEDLKPGDRVAYAMGPIGAYSQLRTIRADVLVKLPDDIPSETAAAMMLQGLTAQYLLRRTHKLQAGETILVHAAAGGVGLILTQWAKALGATVIGTVGSEAKAEIARAHGCDHVILSTDDIAARVSEITHGARLPVVYDSIGRDTFAASLDCLAPYGLLVSYGNASGPVTGVDIGILAAKGSLFVTRPTLATHTAKRADLLAMSEDLFAVVRSGKVRIEVNQTYPLKDASEAHRALESRKTTGSSLLMP